VTTGGGAPEGAEWSAQGGGQPGGLRSQVLMSLRFSSSLSRFGFCVKSDSVET